mmetsp:Transcript_7853/g.19251  ORF Transcript_7853/g.19251 Transcript_7853/m.19251 type:complete len:644 (+) Transcript_7853:1773-3704(+)
MTTAVMQPSYRMSSAVTLGQTRLAAPGPVSAPWTVPSSAPNLAASGAVVTRTTAAPTMQYQPVSGTPNTVSGMDMTFAPQRPLPAGGRLVDTDPVRARSPASAFTPGLRVAAPAFSAPLAAGTAKLARVTSDEKLQAYLRTEKFSELAEHGWQGPPHIGAELNTLNKPMQDVSLQLNVAGHPAVRLEPGAPEGLWHYWEMYTEPKEEHAEKRGVPEWSIQNVALIPLPVARDQEAPWKPPYLEYGVAPKFSVLPTTPVQEASRTTSDYPRTALTAYEWVGEQRPAPFSKQFSAEARGTLHPLYGPHLHVAPTRSDMPYLEGWLLADSEYERNLAGGSSGSLGDLYCSDVDLDWRWFRLEGQILTMWAHGHHAARAAGHGTFSKRHISGTANEKRVELGDEAGFAVSALRFWDLRRLQDVYQDLPLRGPSGDVEKFYEIWLKFRDGQLRLVTPHEQAVHAWEEALHTIMDKLDAAKHRRSAPTNDSKRQSRVDRIAASLSMVQPAMDYPKHNQKFFHELFLMFDRDNKFGLCAAEIEDMIVEVNEAKKKRFESLLRMCEDHWGKRSGNHARIAQCRGVFKRLQTRCDTHIQNAQSESRAVVRALDVSHDRNIAIDEFVHPRALDMIFASNEIADAIAEAKVLSR